MTPLQKLPKIVGDFGKLFVAKGFKKWPKVQKIVQSCQTVGRAVLVVGSAWSPTTLMNRVWIPLYLGTESTELVDLPLKYCFISSVKLYYAKLAICEKPYKTSYDRIYDNRVIPDKNTYIMTLESLFTKIECFRRLPTGKWLWLSW